MGLSTIKALLDTERATSDHAVITGEDSARMSFTRRGSSLFQCAQSGLSPELLALNAPASGATTRLVIAPARTGGHVCTLVQQAIRSMDGAVDPNFYTIGNFEVAPDEYIDQRYDAGDSIVVLATGTLNEEPAQLLGYTQMQVQLWRYEDRSELHLVMA